MPNPTVLPHIPPTEGARFLAEGWHAGQVDKSGKPYIDHVMRVADAVSHLGPEYRIVGLLHDTIEDTAIPADAFSYFPDEVREAVFILTRRYGEEYAEYITRVIRSRNRLARAVKEAALRDNLRPGVPDSLKARYVKALERITDPAE